MARRRAVSRREPETGAGGGSAGARDGCGGESAGARDGRGGESEDPEAEASGYIGT